MPAPPDVPQARCLALHDPLARILPSLLAEGALPSLLSMCLGLGSCLVSAQGTGRGGAGGGESTWGWGESLPAVNPHPLACVSPCCASNQEYCEVLTRLGARTKATSGTVPR